jgi:hypothetical protein
MPDVSQHIRHTLGQRPVSALAVCLVALPALVLAVGMQASAISVGLRWVPAPPTRTLKFVPLEPIELGPFSGRDASDSQWRTWLAWVLAAVAAVMVLLAVVRWLRARTRRPRALGVVRLGADAAVAGGVNARVVASGLLAAIEVLIDERDPGNAVVQAWQALENAAASAGVARRPAETATEFTTRILYRSRNSAAPIGVLLALYQRTRFGEHTPTLEEIAAARSALTALVELWRGDLPGRRVARGAP